MRYKKEKCISNFPIRWLKDNSLFSFVVFVLLVGLFIPFLSFFFLSVGLRKDVKIDRKKS